MAERTPPTNGTVEIARAELKTRNSSLSLSSKSQVLASELFEPFDNDNATFITHLVILCNKMQKNTWFECIIDLQNYIISP